MKFQQFYQLVKLATTYPDYSQFEASAGTEGGLSAEQLQFIWEFASAPAFPTIRQLSGLTQAAFAAAYSTPKRSVENWDTGMRTPPDHLVILLAFAVFSDI